jgi:molecular chaperone GrpE
MILGTDFLAQFLLLYIKIMTMEGTKEYNEEQELNAAAQQENTENTSATAEDETTALQAEVEKLKADLEEEKKKYLFLYSDFENYRRRMNEKVAELIKNGGEKAFTGLLAILDDFERGLAASKDDAESPIYQGMELIYNKLKKYLEQNGVKEFDAEDTFDADRHEAISAIPAPDESLKGKILDVIQKGYTMNDKIIRHAKVVVGQ